MRKGVALIAFTQAWESFSFYGMRALLALYLISELHYSNKGAFALYALYISLVEIGAGLGGYLADRFLGYRGAVLFGGGFIAMGHICMVFSECLPLFFLALGLIITGVTLFKCNLKALLGQIGGRSPEFTWLYMGMNAGGLLATIVCSILAKVYGWDIGFGVAALGMLIGIAIFAWKSPMFKPYDIPVKPPIALTTVCGIASAILFACLLSQFTLTTWLVFPLAILFLGLLIAFLAKDLSRKALWGLLGVLFLLISYFSVEELMGSFLMVYSDTHINRLLFNMQIPASFFIVINPLIIIATGPLLAKLPLKLAYRFSLAFLCLTSAFSALYISSLITSPSAIYLVLGFAMIALGELFLAPAVFSYCAEIAPKKESGLMMGLVTLAFSFASLLSGQLGQLPYSPSILFFAIMMGAALISSLTFVISVKYKKV